MSNNVCSHPLWPFVTKKPLPLLHVLSDLHMESGPYEIPKDLDYDILIAAGDIGSVEKSVPWLAALNKPVVYVLGNHERWGNDLIGAVTQAKTLAQGTQVHVLENNSVVIQGVRFLGATLWTNLRDFKYDSAGIVNRFMQDYGQIDATQWLADTNNQKKLERLYKQQKTGPSKATGLTAKTQGMVQLDPYMTYIEHQKSIGWLKKELAKKWQGPTVVVSHHAPSFESLKQHGIPEHALEATRWSWKDNQNARIAGYASELLAPGRTLDRYTDGIDLWIHGHTHTGMNYYENSTQILCNPRGHHRKPLDISQAKAYLLLGYNVTDDDIEKSKAEHHQDPYQGHALNFNNRCVFNFEDGYTRLLTQALKGPLEALHALKKELTDLLPYAGLGQSIPDLCVKEAFEKRLHDVRQVINTMTETLVGPLRKSKLKESFLVDELKPPSNAYLPYMWEEGDTLKQHHYDDTLKQVDDIIQWAQTLPTYARHSLEVWAVQAHKALTYLKTQHIQAKVMLPSVDALRHVNEHGDIRLILEGQLSWEDFAHIKPNEYWLESELDQTLNNGKIPRCWLVRLDTPRKKTLYLDEQTLGQCLKS